MDRGPGAVRSTDHVDLFNPPEIASQAGEHRETGKRRFHNGFSRLRFELDFSSEWFNVNPGPFEFCMISSVLVQKKQECKIVLTFKFGW